MGTMSDKTVLPDDDTAETATVNTYECEACGTRTDAARSPGDCSDCGGDLRNISTPRQQ